MINTHVLNRPGLGIRSALNFDEASAVVEERRGIVQMCISRTDQFVWIERKNGRRWLITPEEPEAFVRAVSG
jgi:hypothetical protein